MDTAPTKPGRSRSRNRDINRGLLGKFMAHHHLVPQKTNANRGFVSDSGSNCSSVSSTVSNTSRPMNDDSSTSHNIRHLVARLAPSNPLDFQDKLLALERQAALERRQAIAQQQAMSLASTISSHSTRRRTTASSSYLRSDASTSASVSISMSHNSMDHSSDGSSDSETYIDRHHAKPLPSPSPSPSVQQQAPKVLEDDAVSLQDLMSTCSFHSVASSLQDNINRRRLDMAKLGHTSLNMSGQPMLTPPSLSRQSSSNSVTVSVAVDVADTSMQNSFASLPHNPSSVAASSSQQQHPNGPTIAFDEKSGVISDVSLLGFSQSSMMTFSIEELLAPAPLPPASPPRDDHESQEDSLFNSKDSSTNASSSRSDVEQGKKHKQWFLNQPLRMSRLSEKSDTANANANGAATGVEVEAQDVLKDYSQRSRRSSTRSNRSSHHSRHSSVYKDETEHNDDQAEEEPDWVWWGIKCVGMLVICVALGMAIWLALEYNLFGSDNSPALDNHSQSHNQASASMDNGNAIENTDDVLTLGLDLVHTEATNVVDPSDADADGSNSSPISANFSAYDNLGNGQLNTEEGTQGQQQPQPQDSTTNNGGVSPQASPSTSTTESATAATATAAPTAFVPPTRPPSMANDQRLPPPPALSSSTEGLVIWNVLPSYTQIALTANTAQDSEQSKAFAWLSAHPNLLDMPTWRIHQLFGLVSYYHAMQGDQWPAEKKRHWLSYTVPECSWGDAGSPSYLGNSCHSNHDATLRGKYRDLNLEKYWGAAAGAGSYDGTRIPPEIALLSDLRSFGIVNVGLTATFGNLIPSQMATMTSLQHLSFRDNHIGGQIPTWLGAIASLQKIEAGNNHLSGTVPSELGQLTQLQELALYRNQIRGNLPSELGNMRQLTGLTAITNALTGTLPVELGNLQNLEWLYLDGNANMVGTVPSTMCRLPRILSILVDCTVQCGPDPCGSDICSCYDRK